MVATRRVPDKIYMARSADVLNVMFIKLGEMGGGAGGKGI